MLNIKKFRIKSFKDENHILSLEKISFKFGNKIILDNLNLKLNKGQILGLLGPNGAGKSTIFNLIIGLLVPDFGSVNIFSNILCHHSFELILIFIITAYCCPSNQLISWKQVLIINMPPDLLNLQWYFKLTVQSKLIFYIIIVFLNILIHLSCIHIHSCALFQ